MIRKTMGRAGWNQAPQEATDSPNLTAPTRLLILLSSVKRRIWLMDYELEEARQLHAASGHFWKEVGACIALAFLRLGRLV